MKKKHDDQDDVMEVKEKPDAVAQGSPPEMIVEPNDLRTELEKKLPRGSAVRVIKSGKDFIARISIPSMMPEKLKALESVNVLEIKGIKYFMEPFGFMEYKYIVDKEK